MRVLPVSPESIREAITILRNGGVIAHATETCYGLACDLSNPDAVAKLFAIKQRPATQPVSALFSSVNEAKKFVEWSDEAEELAAKYLPGPLTMILKMENGETKLFPSLSPDASTLGVRISSHPLAQELVATFGSPLSTTSANLHGQPNPYSAEDILNQFKDAEVQPDLILDTGVLPQNPPSTVADLTGGKTTKRQGSLKI